MKKFWICLIYGWLSLLKLHGNPWYSEYWQQFFLRSYESDRFGIRTFVRLESGNRWRNIRTYMLSEQFAYKMNNDVALEVHYTYIRGHPLSDSHWRRQHRIELEANKIFRLPCNSQVIARNRLEFRWREKIKIQPDVRFRQRTMFLLPLKTGTALRAIGFFNEIFYDISRRHFEQNRICPCQLTFSITKKIDLDVYVMIRILNEDEVRHSFVMGTQLNF